MKRTLHTPVLKLNHHEGDWCARGDVPYLCEGLLGEVFDLEGFTRLRAFVSADEPEDSDDFAQFIVSRTRTRTLRTLYSEVPHRFSVADWEYLCYPFDSCLHPDFAAMCKTLAENTGAAALWVWIESC